MTDEEWSGPRAVAARERAREAAMARSDFHVALTNALALASPSEDSQDQDIEVVVDQCIALLERAGWEFARRPRVAAGRWSERPA